MANLFPRWFVLGLGLWWFGPAWAMSVAFINPGKPDEAYWASASAAMAQAARSLGVTLEVQYAHRDHVQALALARQLAARAPAGSPAAPGSPASPIRPDYLIFTNDYGTGPEVLRILEGSGIRSFMVFSAVHGRSREETGAPRTRHRLWLGSLEPQAEEAGYLTARALIARAKAAGAARAADGKLQLLAIAGDRSTPSSIARNAGMERAVAEAKDVVLVQQVFGDWRRDKAAEQAAWLYQRYPAARLVWAGNDLMAFGAMDAWRARGGQPGKDAWFSGINTSEEAFASLRSGALSALAGGHFMTGAWALVMLFDYAHGVDFEAQGLEQQRPMFVLFDARLAQRFAQRLLDPAHPLDFRPYSKALNPRRQHYDFSLLPLLQ